MPTAVYGGGTWALVSLGFHTCGIKSDGTLWCWGNNSYGQLGDNSTTQRNVPTAISGGGLWSDVDIAAYHSCGIKTDNSVWCWGNGDGNLGDNTTTQRNVPTAVYGGGTWGVSGGTSCAP